MTRPDFSWSDAAAVRVILETVEMPPPIVQAAEALLAGLGKYRKDVSEALSNLLTPWLPEREEPAPAPLTEPEGYLVGFVGEIQGRRGPIAIDAQAIASLYPCQACGGKLLRSDGNFSRDCQRCGRKWVLVVYGRPDGWALVHLRSDGWNYEDAQPPTAQGYVEYAARVTLLGAEPEPRERWEAYQ